MEPQLSSFCIVQFLSAWVDWDPPKQLSHNSARDLKAETLMGSLAFTNRYQGRRSGYSIRGIKRVKRRYQNNINGHLSGSRSYLRLESKPHAGHDEKL